MKKTFFLLFAITFLLSCNQNNKEEITIGAILPLTGDYAIAGINTKKGIDLAVSLINRQDGINGKKIKVVYEDTKGEPKLGVNAVTKLIDVNKVDYIIDNSISSITLAVAPIVEKNKVVLMATGASSPKITKAGDYIFRIWNSDNFEAEIMASFAEDSLNIDNIGIFFMQNDFGIGLKEAFSDNFNDENILIVESFSGNKNDYNTELIKLLSNEIDAIYLVGYSSDCITIIEQLKKLNFKGILLGTSVMLDENVSNSVKNSNLSLYYPVPKSVDSKDSKYIDFNKKYFEKYNSEPPPLSDVGYDATMLLYNALNDLDNYNGTKIKDRLYQIKEYYGASGTFSFDENGDVKKPIQIIKK